MFSGLGTEETSEKQFVVAKSIKCSAKSIRLHRAVRYNPEMVFGLWYYNGSVGGECFLSSKEGG